MRETTVHGFGHRCVLAHLPSTAKRDARKRDQSTNWCVGAQRIGLVQARRGKEPDLVPDAHWHLAGHSWLHTSGAVVKLRRRNRLGAGWWLTIRPFCSVL